MKRFILSMLLTLITTPVVYGDVGRAPAVVVESSGHGESMVKRSPAVITDVVSASIATELAMVVKGEL